LLNGDILEGVINFCDCDGEGTNCHRYGSEKKQKDEEKENKKYFSS